MAVCLDYQCVYVRKRAYVPMRYQVATVLFLFVALSTKVWLKMSSTDLGYALARERSATIELDMQRRELELKRSILQRADSLQRMAEKRLGLFPLEARRARKISYRF